VRVRGLLNPVRKITCLSTGKAVEFEQEGVVVPHGGLPARRPTPWRRSIGVEVKGKLQTEM